MQNFTNSIKVESIIAPEDIASAAETSADQYVTTVGKGKIMGMLVHAKLTSTKTAVCQLTCSSDTSGTGKADVSGKTATLTGGTSKVDIIPFRVEDLDIDNSKIFAGVDITTNQNNDNISAVLMSMPDYPYDTINPN